MPATTRSWNGSPASPERRNLRNAADAERIALLARELGRVVDPGTRLYLTGGATAVFEGWRDSTVDVDIRLEPDSDAAFRQIGKLKEELSLNIELASPLDFLPALEGWMSWIPTTSGRRSNR